MDKFPDAVYVGSGSLKHKLKPGILSTPFRPGPDGDPATRVALFSEMLVGDTKMNKEVDKTFQTVQYILGDCHFGYPCHREAIAFAVWTRRPKPIPYKVKSLQVSINRRSRSLNVKLTPAKRVIQGALLAGSAC